MLFFHVCLLSLFVLFCFVLFCCVPIVIVCVGSGVRFLIDDDLLLSLSFSPAEESYKFSVVFFQCRCDARDVLAKYILLLHTNKPKKKKSIPLFFSFFLFFFFLSIFCSFQFIVFSSHKLLLLIAVGKAGPSPFPFSVLSSPITPASFVLFFVLLFVVRCLLSLLLFLLPRWLLCSALLCFCSALLCCRCCPPPTLAAHIDGLFFFFFSPSHSRWSAARPELRGICEKENTQGVKRKGSAKKKVRKERKKERKEGRKETAACPANRRL